jgi:hypothetical protein
MAKAEKTTLERIVKEEGVTLHLTMDEVRTLVAVATMVSGDAVTSPRKHTDAIGRAIEDAMGKSRYDWGWIGLERGLLNRSGPNSGIRFESYPEEDA